MPPRGLPYSLIVAIAVVAVVLFAAPVLAGRRGHWTAALRRFQPAETGTMKGPQVRPDVCLLGGALLFHVLIVVMAHSLYRMGESIHSFRFYVPVYWIGLWLLAL
jgi:hypothetical protein